MLRFIISKQSRCILSPLSRYCSKLPAATTPTTINPPSSSSSPKGFNIDSNDMFDKNRVSVRGFGDTCFVVNDVMIEQSIILLPHNVLMWDAKKIEDITIESLSIFPL